MALILMTIFRVLIKQPNGAELKSYLANKEVSRTTKQAELYQSGPVQGAVPTPGSDPAALLLGVNV